MKIYNIGKRMTRSRRNILSILSNSSKPKTAQEIHEETKNVDLTSVYRNLELLVTANLALVCDFGDGKKRYELKNKIEHHHHLICEKCGEVKDVKINEKTLLKKISSKKNFLIKKHNLEFFGLCSECH